MRKYDTPLSSAGGNRPARTLTWIDGRISAGGSGVASRCWRMATKVSSSMPSCTWMLCARCSPGPGGAIEPAADEDGVLIAEAPSAEPI